MNMPYAEGRFSLAAARPEKKKFVRSLLPAFIALISANATFADSEYLDRFHEIRSDIYNPANGYLSADGGPYHSVETLIVEAPDHGHQSTSEAYSYILLLEAVHGKLTGDWEPLRAAWDLIEDHIIPTDAMQPTANKYNPSAPATYIPEGPLPSFYPGPLVSNVPVGRDPVSAELAQTYGTWSVYGMHWLLDLDNTYGYGNFGDGVSTPSYINTFQRGVQESVWETVTHPSWEDFSWGNAYGFLQLFVDETAPARQWRYTNAPDADARAVQVLYWALEWIREQGKNPDVVIPGLASKASKMGDYLRLAMFDKYFKVMGANSESAPGGNGYDSAHYLMSWYYAWGGPVDTSQNWGFRISSSHVHFGYQNPVAAYALSQIPELKPASPGGARDWATSLERSLQFYQWLQSKEGAIAGGATNSWGGAYQPRPYQADFYGMTYDPNPVYHDPGSGTWFGWQVWSMERMAEYYYITGDSRANNIMDKWIQWALSPDVLEFRDGDVFVAGELSWSGLPENWNAANPQPNNNLSVTVVNRGQDVGVAHSLARTLMYYAAAEKRHDVAEHTASRDAAKQILDIMWTQHRTDKGIAIPETRGDYVRFNEPVHIPAGYNGVTATGGVLDQNTTFISQRPFYLQDPMYQEVLDARAENRDPVFTYHRYWAQVEVAVANALYDELFIGSQGGSSSSSSSTSSQESSSSSISSISSSLSSSISSNSSSSASGGNNNCQYIISNEWNNGFTGLIRITNNTQAPINGWSVNWSYTDGSLITNSWNASFSGSNPYSASNLSWNSTIQPGQSVEFGFQGSKSSSSTQQPVVTGSACQ